VLMCKQLCDSARHTSHTMPSSRSRCATVPVHGMLHPAHRPSPPAPKRATLPTPLAHRALETCSVLSLARQGRQPARRFCRAQEGRPGKCTAACNGVIQLEARPVQRHLPPPASQETNNRDSRSGGGESSSSNSSRDKHGRQQKQQQQQQQQQKQRKQQRRILTCSTASEWAAQK
jgi:hypothetical protein